MSINPEAAAQILLSVFGDLVMRGGESPTPHRDVAIGDAEAEYAARKAVEREYLQLTERMDRMVLLVHAMWSLLEEKTSVTDADLLRRLSEMEAASQQPREPIRCSCGAAVNRRLHRCLFCGKEYKGAEPFETL